MITHICLLTCDLPPLLSFLNQLGRRNLTDDQRAIVVDELIERQGKVRRAKQKDEITGKWKTVSDAVADTVTDSKADTRKELSQKAKVSERKVKKARKLRKDHPELAEKVRPIPEYPVTITTPVLPVSRDYNLTTKK